MVFYVYLLASRKHGTLYTGVTNDLARRIHEHRDGQGSAFPRRCRVSRMVRHETYPMPEEAIRQASRSTGSRCHPL
ncbi:GIY-YIG nuclease family protein [uncultured Roseibium sp.]|uniref:GIY-YIG nuclease family protein n=1 Tax=uncultured Roseibium sp. TaxID=1936171 RepID=UPI002599C02A|nr:GIY-YIG nuclease family protein [uncultured Roseibium sp.]